MPFSSVCPKYNKNYIKGREKGCVSFYRIIFVFGCCPGAWQPANNIITSVTPIAGSLCASHSDTHPARRAPSESSTLYLSLRSLTPPRHGEALAVGVFWGSSLLWGFSAVTKQKQVSLWQSLVAGLEEVKESQCQSLGHVFQDCCHSSYTRSYITRKAASPEMSQHVGCI